MRRALFALLLLIGLPALAQTTPRTLTYATHDGVALVGDFYAATGAAPHGALVAVHGGGWQGGDRTIYQYLGPYLAAHGTALLAIDYRLATPGHRTWPAAVGDVRAAIQYVRAHAAELGIDPARIGLVGDSAGAQLAALVALHGDAAEFAGLYPSDPDAATPVNVKVMVGLYGVYDMAAQWNHDTLSRPSDQITEKFLGAPPSADRLLYFNASPLSYAITANRRTAFLLGYGTEDDVADRATQSDAFMLALKQAGFFVRNAIIQGAGHYWIAWPMEENNSPAARFAPHLLRFLADRL